MQNLFHDEIGGCGIDPVHREMMYRYDKVEQLLDSIQAEAALVLAENTAFDPSRGQPHLVFNASAARLSGAARAKFIIDRRLLSPEEISLSDEYGNKIDFQIAGVREHYFMRINEARSRTEVDIVFDCGVIEPFSFKLVYMKKEMKTKAGLSHETGTQASGTGRIVQRC